MLEASLTLFADQGFHATTLEQIALLAGVSKGTIFNNFASKAAVYSETVDAVVEHTATRMRASIEGAEPGFASFALVVRQLLTMFDEETTSTRLLLRELTRPPFDTDLPESSLRGTVIVPLVEILTAVRTDVSEQDTSMSIVRDEAMPIVAAALAGALAVAAIDRQVHHADQSVDDVVVAVLAALSGLNPHPATRLDA